MKNKIIQGDCLEVMKDIPNKSIDMILCDLPYGTTACKWDTIIPFEPLWEQYKRIIKDNGAIVLTASQPFTSALVMSNIKMFKYEWIWEKPNGTSPFKAKYMPMVNCEEILVFGSGKLKYNPQMEIGKPYKWNSKRTKGDASNIKQMKETPINNKGTRHPKNILRFKQERGLHPTQKPVALFEYLQLTYTNEGDTILDNCSGSGTTAIAADNIRRNWICIEKDPNYVTISKKRINENRIRLNSNLLEKFDLQLLT